MPKSPGDKLVDVIKRSRSRSRVKEKNTAPGGPIPPYPDGDITKLDGIQEERTSRLGDENSHLIYRIQRQKDVTPLGTIQALKEFEQLELSGEPYLSTQSISKRYDTITSLGFTLEMADTITRHFPDLKYVVPISINTCNTLAFAISPKGIFALKRTDLAQGQTEDALLRILAKEEFQELKRNIPRLILSKDYSDGNYLIATQVGKPRVLDIDGIIEERMRTVGLLHGYSPKIISQLREAEINLGRKDFGNINQIIAQINSGEEQLLTPDYEGLVRDIYPECVDFLRKNAERDPKKYVVDMDTKDENWVAGGTTKIDLAVAKEDDPKHYDYSRIVFDKLCQGYSGLPTDLIKISLDTENSASPVPTNIVAVNENIFLTMIAGIVYLPRLIASNVTKRKIETAETNRHYVKTLKMLISGRQKSLPSYRHLGE